MSAAGDTTHGRFRNPVEATLTGIKDLRGPQELASELTLDMRLDGRTCLVTGASSGLGLALAVQLAQRGARVIMVSRSGIPERGQEVRWRSGSEDVLQIRTDLSDLAQVHTLADDLAARGERVDVLVDNAGVATPAARKTPQGFDAMFATNFLSKVLLARRLLADGTIRNTTYTDAPRKSGEPIPRILYISSDSHRGASAIDMENLGVFYEYGVNKGINNYSYFKLVLNTYATELARRLAHDKVIDVPVHVLCPGPVDSEIARDAPPRLKRFMDLAFRIFFRPPEVAARPAVYMCAAEQFAEETNRYLHMFNPKAMDAKVYEQEVGARLWTKAENLLRDVGMWPTAGG